MPEARPPASVDPAPDPTAPRLVELERLDQATGGIRLRGAGAFGTDADTGAAPLPVPAQRPEAA